MMHGGDIFAVAREHGWDWREVLDCSASINPLGPAPGVIPAIQQAMDRIVHYPERASPALRAALANLWNIDADQILLGNGATELIFFLARMLADSPVTLALPAFSEFHRAFPLARVQPLSYAALRGRGLLVITRPANPTGESLPLNVLREHLEASEGPVLVDESFLEFSGLESAATLMSAYPHLLVLRSLTKFYALPGLRLGALVSSAANTTRWQSQREPWQVNVLAEAAALAAIADTAHAASSVEFASSERAWLFEQLKGIAGTEPRASDANFLYVKLACSASGLCEHLLRDKILIRNCTDWPGLFGEAVRVAVRRRDENERLLKAWREFRCA
ncbi:MAG: L-threonine-O-3-phosphate decarboxylase [Bryobacterales bacterium]|nr:L-threonine-O-3-phosphate decarboxylase [Bryobacterales bacterium]